MFGIKSLAELGKALIKHWYIFILIGMSVLIWWYRQGIASLEGERANLKAEVLKTKYRISELEGQLKGKEKELIFQEKQMGLLKSLKEKERVIENHYHERVVENHTTIKQFEDSNEEDWTPILDQIDNYFGIKPIKSK